MYAEDEDITIANSTISGNSADGNGGGVYAEGSVTLTSSTISGNSASGNGGGLFSEDDDITLTDSEVTGNSADDDGGGIYAESDITLTNSTISGNSAGDDGGGINADDDITLTNSTVSGNIANDNGGGIYADDEITLTNSTVSGNSAGGEGGGMYADDEITLTNSTVSGNSASGEGGGIYTDDDIDLYNSIVANNSDDGTSPDVSDGDVTAYNSLIEDTTGIGTITGSNNIFGQDPQLLPLGDYGGPTQTHGLAPTSPALNTGDNSFASGLSTDQRGAPGQRIVDGIVDIGAFEFQGGFEIVPVGDQNLTVSSAPSTLDVSVKVVEVVFNLLPNIGVTVDFSAVGDVTGSFTNGTSVITDSNGIAANFFNWLSGTGDVQILAASTGLESLTFNITNNVPVTVTNPVTVTSTELTLPSNIEQEFDSLEIESKDVLFGRGCVATPTDRILQTDNEDLNVFEEENQNSGEENNAVANYDSDCKPIGGEDNAGEG